MFGLFDDFLQQPFTVLQAGDFRFVVGQRPSQAQPFVPEGGASWVWHHHRAQLLLVELDHENKNKHEKLEKEKRERVTERGRQVQVFYFSHHLMQIVFQNVKAVVWFRFLWRHLLVLLFIC